MTKSPDDYLVPYSYEEAMDRALAEGKDNLQYERNPHDPAEQAGRHARPEGARGGRG